MCVCVCVCVDGEQWWSSLLLHPLFLAKLELLYTSSVNDKQSQISCSY